MHCSSCGFDNPEGMRFCGQCGSPLTLRCPRCKSDNPPDFSFCGQCGGSLAAAPPAPVVEADASPGGVLHSTPPEGERRQLTVMFCDLVGSTALSLDLDPEELREVVQAYQRASVRVIERYEGYVAQYLGDGLLVYFGYPVAHEDEAERAIHAGLGILRELDALARRLQQEQGIDLEVRIGIHTGVVVVGEMGGGGRREYLAMGEVPNVAARVQSIAQPGSLVISETTYRLVAVRFECEDLGPKSLKGLSGAARLYQVIRERDLDNALGGLVWDPATAPIGREQDVDLLMERWSRVAEGSGQVVTLCGEPGIGKSYLVQAFRHRLRGQPHHPLLCRCSPYYEHSAFHPLVELLHRMLNFYAEQPVGERLDMIEMAAERNGFPVQEAVPLLATLLSVPYEDRYAPSGLSPKEQKERAEETLVALLLKMAAERPLVLFFEDLHWADPSTLDVLDRLVDRAAEAPILLLLTFRPVFTSPWRDHPEVTRIVLNRLPRGQVTRLVDQVTGGKHLPDAVMQQIVTRTDGVPLFVEELTKMVLESGLLHEGDQTYELTQPLPPLAIPTTLHDSLMARLDRLATVKEVAQLGACLGRTFSYDLLHAVAGLDEGALRHALTQLVEAELLYQQGVPPESTYLFKHALVQDTAYQSLLKSTRQKYHQRIAHQLEDAFAETVATQPELVAHHYEAAGLSEPATAYWLRAAQRAAERSANVEALAHVRRGLELLGELPPTPDRDRRELDLQLIHGAALITTRGYAAPSVGRTYERALELCRMLGEEGKLFPILFGRFATHFVRAEWRQARIQAVHLLELAEAITDRPIRQAAQVAMGSTLFSLGELDEALHYLDEALALYDPEEHRGLAVRYGQDNGVVAHVYAGFTRWTLGYPEQGLGHIDQALVLARTLEHSHSLALALSFATSMRYFRQEPEAAGVHAAELHALSKKEGFRHWLYDSNMMLAWVRARQGESEEALRLLEASERDFDALAIENELPYHQPMVADFYGTVGHVEEGLALIEQSLREMEARGEPWSHASELHRLRGDLLRRKGGVDPEAEACFRRALEIADGFGARMLALRAAVHLGALWNRQGRLNDARQLIAPRYATFTEGFNTADLREARALLDAMEPVVP